MESISKPRVYLTLPFIDKVEPESMAAANRATAGKLQVDGKLSRSSALCRGINTPWCEALNSQPAYDFFSILHSDVAPEGHYLDVLHAEMVKHDLDVIHAFSPIKDHYGLTSTAFGSLTEPWRPVRRITTYEIEQLPSTFTIEDLEGVLGRYGFKEGEKLCMLCNTATLVVRLKPRMMTGPGPYRHQKRPNNRRAEWPRCFPGFTVLDRILEDETEFLHAESVSEDWWFGRWAAQHGLRVGGTRLVSMLHYGRHGFSNDHAWGTHQRDEAFFMRTAINQDLEKGAFHHVPTRSDHPEPSDGVH